MSERFVEAVDFVLEMEGGYVHDPVDRGGETNYGISKAAHPSVDIKALTLETAVRIYWEQYWLPIQADKMPRPIALALFDWHVHSGLKAIQSLQRQVRVAQDGIIGPVTLAAIDLDCTNTGSPLPVAIELIKRRGSFIAKYVAEHPKQSKFLAGWTSRLIELTALVCSEPDPETEEDTKVAA